MTRTECIPQQKTPDGKEWAVFKNPDNHLYYIRQKRTDDMGDIHPDMRASLPEMLCGEYTGERKAYAKLSAYLSLMWDKCDAAQVDALKKSVGKAKAESIIAARNAGEEAESAAA